MKVIAHGILIVAFTGLALVHSVPSAEAGWRINRQAKQLSKALNQARFRRTEAMTETTKLLSTSVKARRASTGLLVASVFTGSLSLPIPTPVQQVLAFSMLAGGVRVRYQAAKDRNKAVADLVHEATDLARQGDYSLRQVLLSRSWGRATYGRVLKKAVKSGAISEADLAELRRLAPSPHEAPPAAATATASRSIDQTRRRSSPSM
jgi:hypothetical protein